MTKILEQITHLPIEEKIVLVERVWYNIADDTRSQTLAISPELKAELARLWHWFKRDKRSFLAGMR